MAENKLTVKQERFVDYYDGNATEAARKAGYMGNDHTLGAVGKENLEKPGIRKAIEKRNAGAKKKTILNREQRQKIWSMITMGKNPKTGQDDALITIRDQLKASELLGKSECDFIQKIEHGGTKDMPINVNITVEGVDV